MSSFKTHPLLEISAKTQAGEIAGGEMNTEAGPSLKAYRGLRRRLGAACYPLKNRLERFGVERKLRALGASLEKPPIPDIICFGQKGFGNEIFLKQILPRLGSVETVVCFGCGTGEELALVADVLRPRRVIGYDFFAYPKAWTTVRRVVEAELPVGIEFRQLDLRTLGSKGTGEADLVISFAVLEHLRDMDLCFAQVKSFLKAQGMFASSWGPMWYSYSGDHIAAELGFSHGFDHLLLSPADYLQFYRSHPRNQADVAAGKPTWLELGLHNFARYDEYIACVQRWFGPVQFLKWQLSAEAFRWAKARPGDWRRLLELHPSITPLDLVLGGAAVLARPA